jgi:hypothetical protein
MVDATELAVGRDELDRNHAVRRQAKLAGVPADAAAERVAGDAYVRRRAVQRGESEIRRLRDHVAPLRAGTDAGDAALDVELDALHRIGLDEDDVVQRAKRLGVVTRALGGDLHAVRAGELDDLDHVLLVGG